VFFTEKRVRKGEGEGLREGNREVKRDENLT
jgi:hypothetical protein